MEIGEIKMNCKPQDLAYVVGSCIEEQNGMVVRVERMGVNGFGWWEVTFSGSVVTRAGKIANGIAQIHDDYLRPINGVPVTDDVHDEVPA